MNDLDVQKIIDAIENNYWVPLYQYLEKNPELIQTFPAFLLNPEMITLYLGKTHIGIEYSGRERTNELPPSALLNISYQDLILSELDFFEEIIGFQYDSTLGKSFRMPLYQYSEDLVLPTNRGVDKLVELKWNWSAQNSLIGINSFHFYIEEGKFTRLVNGRFYDSDDSGLKTRHIKWIDFIPLEVLNINEDSYQIKINIGELIKLVQHDAHYEFPLPHEEDFKYNKLPQLNRFIELVGNRETTEPQITKFLEDKENQFILTMGFLGLKIFPQILCEWQSEINDNIKPDFFIEKPNGYSDIVEFKLPELKSKSIVGKVNRETFSAEINSYISQTRVYREYFEDPNNRNWIKDNYNITIRYPRRTLVIGRRWDFTNEEWKKIIEDYTDIDIITYDDLIDGVMSQFYM